MAVFAVAHRHFPKAPFQIVTFPDPQSHSLPVAVPLLGCTVIALDDMASVATVMVALRSSSAARIEIPILIQVQRTSTALERKPSEAIKLEVDVAWVCWELRKDGVVVAWILAAQPGDVVSGTIFIVLVAD